MSAMLPHATDTRKVAAVTGGSEEELWE